MLPESRVQWNLTSSAECASAEPKLGDAGLSRAIEGANLPNSGQLNSLEWMAPERLVGEVGISCQYSNLISNVGGPLPYHGPA